jgi:hypothetical protein
MVFKTALIVLEERINLDSAIKGRGILIFGCLEDFNQKYKQTGNANKKYKTNGE